MATFKYENKKLQERQSSPPSRRPMRRSLIRHELTLESCTRCKLKLSQTINENKTYISQLTKSVLHSVSTQICILTVCSFSHNQSVFSWASLRKPSLSIAHNNQPLSGDSLLKQLWSFSSMNVVAGSISLGFSIVLVLWKRHGQKMTTKFYIQCLRRFCSEVIIL